MGSKVGAHNMYWLVSIAFALATCFMSQRIWANFIIQSAVYPVLLGMQIVIYTACFSC
jgi:hypothetical protein